MLLQNPQFTKLISVPHFYKHIIDGLLAHFFPDTNDSTSIYIKEDIEFFLTFANEQNLLEDAIDPDDQSKSVVHFSKYKFYLDRILCKGWNNSGTDVSLLPSYKLEVNSKRI